jgi:hypothetical protein
MAFPVSPNDGDKANVNGVTYTYSSSLTAWTVTSNFLDTFTGNALVANSATIAGELSTSTIVSGNILPSANATYALGSATSVWQDIYLSNSTIFLGEATISASGANVVLPATVQIGDVLMKNIEGNTIEFFSADGTTPASISSENIDVDSASISNGESSLSIATENGNIVANVAGADVVTISSSGVTSNFFVSPRTISANTTVGNINAMSSGPVIIADGVTVTVSSGGDWSIL